MWLKLSRLGLIKKNPYERFQDKRGEKSDRPHLTEAQVKKLIRMPGRKHGRHNEQVS